MDEGRKRVPLIAAAILAARKLAQYEGGKRVPATICAILRCYPMGGTDYAPDRRALAGGMMQILVELNEMDLLGRMRNFEDHFVERKTIKDQKDWKKTVVAFANSAPIGLPAVLYIGVRDNGEIETPQANLDEIQKKFNGQMQRVYPRVPYVPKIISENGQQALAVIVPGSELRPHFAGLSYVRRGSESFEASEQQFVELIASRTAKSREILKWREKVITVHHLNVEVAMHALGRVASTREMFVQDCNSFYVTLGDGNQQRSSYPLRNVDLSFDHQKGRLALEIRPV